MTAHAPITGWLTPEDHARAAALTRPGTVELIAAEVSGVTGIPVGAILSKALKPRSVVQARWMVWAIASRHGLSLPQIARVTGHDHTSVMHGIRRDRELRGEA